MYLGEFEIKRKLTHLEQITHKGNKMNAVLLHWFKIKQR